MLWFMAVSFGLTQSPQGTLGSGVRVGPAALDLAALVAPADAATPVGTEVQRAALLDGFHATCALITQYGVERRDPNDSPWVVRCFDEPWRVADVARAATDPLYAQPRVLQALAITVGRAIGRECAPGDGQGTLPIPDAQGAVFAMDFIANGPRVMRLELLDPLLEALHTDRATLHARGVALAQRSAASIVLEGPELEADLALIRASVHAGWAALPRLLAHFDVDVPLIVDWINAEHVPLPDELTGKVEGGVLAAEMVDGLGWVVIGDLQANRYDMSAVAAVLDPGGDDHYAWGASAARDTAIVDLGGQDRYEGGEVGGPGAGIASVSFIDDYAGNDSYRGSVLSVGAACFGAGIIRDRAGNDRYDAHTWSIGAALYGVGAILDESGHDEYRSAYLSQAVGGPRGVGVIVDRTGDDRYIADFALPSAYDTPATNCCFSQGVGYGFRRFAAGGVGLLDDGAGDDRYEAGEFGQGGGYLHGLGVLRDRAGRDLYRGDRYSQGFAAHMAFGALLDDGGDDVYWGRTAANQGAAWDASSAVLVDASGNDHYRGSVLAQGSGAMQAIGMLVDLAGVDAYDAPGPYAHGTSGNNTYHCDTGALSFSVLLDAGEGSARINGTDASGSHATGSRNETQPCESQLYGVRVIVGPGAGSERPRAAP